MRSLKNISVLFIAIFVLAVSSVAIAGDVKILAVDLYSSTDKNWLVKVTLEHNDTGWDHFADSWQVVDSEGKVLGSRVLQHPHVNEQPFTRELAGVKIPGGIKTVYIEAHDKVHGWSKNRLTVDLTKVSGKHLRVEAN